MISAETHPTARGFAARLASKARRLAEAQAEERRRAIIADPRRWRSARLLWPLFGDR